MQFINTNIQILGTTVQFLLKIWMSNFLKIPSNCSKCSKVGKKASSGYLSTSTSKPYKSQTIPRRLSIILIVCFY